MHTQLEKGKENQTKIKDMRAPEQIETKWPPCRHLN